jgi:protein phosphatase
MSPNEAARVMVDLANLRGGPDNITVVIVKVNQPVPLDAASQTAGKRSARSTSGGSSTPVIVASIVFALSMLFVLMFLLTGSYLTAALPGVAAVGSLIFLFYQFLLSGVAPDRNAVGGKAFGRGPYVRINCPSGEAFAAQMSKLLKELQEGAVDKGWEVDWDQLKTLVATAESAVKSKQFSKAVAGYGRAISFMMDQLRNQNSGSSSSIDL